MTKEPPNSTAQPPLAEGHSVNRDTVRYRTEMKIAAIGRSAARFVGARTRDRRKVTVCADTPGNARARRKPCADTDGRALSCTWRGAHCRATYSRHGWDEQSLPCTAGKPLIRYQRMKSPRFSGQLHAMSDGSPFTHDHILCFVLELRPSIPIVCCEWFVVLCEAPSHIISRVRLPQRGGIILPDDPDKTASDNIPHHARERRIAAAR